MNPDEIDPKELLRQAEHWSPEARSAAAEMVKRMVEGEIAAWYCTRGRICDGKAHPGYPYSHARGDQ